MLDLFGFLAPLLGILMEWIYHFTQNYGVTIVLFTLIIKVLLFPLMMKQQKSRPHGCVPAHDERDP